MAGAASARAEAPVFGVGIGIGEAGSLGFSARLRPLDFLQIEAALGGYVYIFSDGRDDISGVVPAYSGELIFFFTDRTSPGQHGLGLLVSYEEIRGAIGGIGYRYERYFRNGRGGLHVDVGIITGSDVEQNVTDFYNEETGNHGDLDEYTFIPISLKIGYHF